MPFPPAIDQAIRQRFADLIAEGGALQTRLWSGNKEDAPATEQSSDFHAFRTKALGLMHHVGTTPKLMEQAEVASPRPSQVGKIVGVLRGLFDDYVDGFLDPIIRRAEAEVAADYLGQAEGLLKEGQPGKYDHVPAAVLLGALLEQALRTLCGRQAPPLPVVKPNGEKLMMNALIDDLKKAGIYNELKAKQLRAWAGIRNAAAHGEFGEFTKADVEGMQHGVAGFLADHL